MKSPSLISQPVQTHQRNELLEVTGDVKRLAREAGISSGMAIICIPHTTAAVTINENADPDVKHDILAKLTSLIPKDESYYQHGEGNSDSHLKTSLVGSSVTVLIEDGQLILGRWQGIYFCEFDGPRQRQMLVKLVDFEQT